MEIVKFIYEKECFVGWTIILTSDTSSVQIFGRFTLSVAGQADTGVCDGNTLVYCVYGQEDRRGTDGSLSVMSAI